MSNATPDASVTVTLGDRSFTFNLSGDELSRTEQADGTVHRYLSNASRDFIASEVEQALIRLTAPSDAADEDQS